jgi:hypothetical protein
MLLWKTKAASFRTIGNTLLGVLVLVVATEVKPVERRRIRTYLPIAVVAAAVCGTVLQVVCAWATTKRRVKLQAFPPTYARMQN